MSFTNDPEQHSLRFQEHIYDSRIPRLRAAASTQGRLCGPDQSVGLKMRQEIGAALVYLLPTADVQCVGLSLFTVDVGPAPDRVKRKRRLQK